MSRIVVIEDEPGIADFITRGLNAAGFAVQTAFDGDAGLALALGHEVDLVVLDLMLPGRSGAEILDELADDRPGLPIIVLTARGELADRVRGLHAGAVDYMVKPFALAELDARIRAQLRVHHRTPETMLRCAGLTVDLLARRVSRDGRLIRLTTTEFDLLAFLMRHPGQVLDRTQILRSVWGTDHDPQTNIVDVYVGYLRRKLQAPGIISAVRSRGYRLGEDSAG